MLVLTKRVLRYYISLVRAIILDWAMEVGPRNRLVEIAVRDLLLIAKEKDS
jgi:hypothetical protein